MKAAGVWTIEGRGAVHPHADGDGYLAIANAFGQAKRSGESAVRGDAMQSEPSELADALAVDKDLISVIEVLGHLHGQGAVCTQTRQFSLYQA